LVLIRNVSLFAQKAVLFHLKSNTHLAFIEIVMSETAIMTAIIAGRNTIQPKSNFICLVRLRSSVSGKPAGKIHPVLVIHYENLFPQFSPHA